MKRKEIVFLRRSQQELTITDTILTVMATTNTHFYGKTRTIRKNANRIIIPPKTEFGFEKFKSKKKTQFSVKTSPFHLFFDHRKRSTLKLWEIVFKRPGILPRIDNNIPIQNDIFETIDANDFDDEYTTAKVSIRGRAETRIFLLQRFYVNSISMVLKVQKVASLTI